jgi:hypothetical protein
MILIFCMLKQYLLSIFSFTGRVGLIICESLEICVVVHRCLVLALACGRHVALGQPSGLWGGGGVDNFHV